MILKENSKERMKSKLLNKNLILILVLFASNSLAQSVKITDDKIINSKTFEFRITVEGNFILNAYQCALNFNQSVINGGTLSFTISKSGLTNPPKNTAIRNNMLTFYSDFGADTIRTEDSIGTFRLINTKDFTGSTNLQWNFITPLNTIFLSGFNDITSAINFTGADTPLPVVLRSFTAKNKNNAVYLNWQTITELNCYGFEVERATAKGGWKRIVFVKGNGTSSSIKYYGFIDKYPLKWLNTYRLKQIDNNGSFEYLKEVKINYKNTMPVNFVLNQNYPNPFNTATKISFNIPPTMSGTRQGGFPTVQLKVYDIIGHEVITLVDEQKSPGYYEVTFNGQSRTSGIYIYQLRAGKEVLVKKMILIK
jgi:hypothetical protein